MKTSLTPHGPGFQFLDAFQSNGATCGTASVYLDPAHPVFEAHFPGRPLFPAVLLVECAAQGAGVLWMQGNGNPEEPLFLAGVEQFRVLSPVLPGETVTSRITLTKNFGSIAQFEVECVVGDRPVGKGRLILSRQIRSNSATV
jgi:3-hydroxyacyl-[acyl-carrier-protein] dehydratase